MSISLSHLSEVLFAAMVNRRREAFLSLLDLERVADLDYVRAANTVASCEVPLAPFGGRTFDGASRVDVVVRVRRDLAVPFELKLGTTRLGKTRVDGEWLLPCTTSHNDTRWKGNMIGILDRRFSMEVRDALAATLGGEHVVLTSTWFVVARRSTISAWTRWKPGFSQHARFLAFEDAVQRFGGREPFNQLVAENLIADFFEEWGMS